MRSLSALFPGLPVLLLVLSGCSSFHSGSQASSDLMKTAQPASVHKPDDLIRSGDSLIIRLTGVPTDDQGVFEVKVDESGQISMPYIGNIPAVGLTTVLLKQKIETLYKLKKIFTNPNITVLANQERYVSVTGEVRNPQRMIYTKDITALSAIAGCGGFTDYADRRHCKVLRGPDTIEFNANDILNDPSKDVPLLPDDKIQINRSIF
ncbi:MAG: polysaccharide biosynthesis/export family protein [Methylacidiphilales bacterium]|nr:polysaccharide biosynthesis/export family protein [Candidatus Methylacidiphilales bacterium]